MIPTFHIKETKITITCLQAVEICTGADIIGNRSFEIIVGNIPETMNEGINHDIWSHDIKTLLLGRITNNLHI